MGLELSKNLADLRAKAWLPVPILWSVQTLGFLIGFTVVRDVRWAAHSTIIEKPVAGPTVAEAAKESVKGSMAPPIASQAGAEPRAA